MQYVGDAVTVTYTTTAGATVTVTVVDPDGNVVDSAVPATESPAGTYSHTFVLDVPGIWTVQFVASGVATAFRPYYVRALPADGPPPLATVGDVVEVLGTLTSDQERLAEGLLRRASEMVRAHPLLGDFADRVAAGTLPATAAGEAVLNMVLRVMRNPAGLRSEAAGPFSRAYDLEAASALLRITDAEMDLLLPGWNSQPWTLGSVTSSPALMGYEPWRERLPVDRWGRLC